MYRPQETSSLFLGHLACSFSEALQASTQLDDACCQTGVSQGGKPASSQHPTICLHP